MRFRGLIAMTALCSFALSGLAVAGEAKKGGPAPFFFMSSYNPDSCGMKRVFLDRLVGEKAKPATKVLLITFFDVDCKPCRKELPFLQRLYRRYKDKGLMILAVNCDYLPEKMAQIKKFIADAGIGFPVLKDRLNALRRRYGVSNFPTMFIVDSRGTIVDIRVGYNEKKMPFPLASVQRMLGVAEEPVE